MAYSYQTAVSDGTLDTLAVSIPYFDRSEISVYFDDVANDYPWSWVGTTEATLAFSPPIPNGVVVQIKRNTDISARRHDFSGGAMFTSESIDENFEQIMRMAQEAKEGGWGEGVDTFKDTLASSAGGTLVGVLYGGETRQLEQVLDEQGAVLDGLQDSVDAAEAAISERIPEIANYEALRAYTGPVTAYYVRGVANIFDGGAGVFRVDAADTTTADNGGTVLVDATGRRWKREYEGWVHVGWFGVRGDGVTDNADAYDRVSSFVDGYSTGFTGFPAQGLKLWFPRGIYMQSRPTLYSKACVIDGDNAILRGIGVGYESRTVPIVGGGTEAYNGLVIFLYGEKGSVSAPTMYAAGVGRGITLDCNEYAYPALYIERMPNSSINCGVFSSSTNGVEIGPYMWGLNLDDIICESNTYANIVFKEYAAANGMSIRNPRIWGRFKTSQCGIRFEDGSECNGLSISGGYIEKLDVGVFAGAGSGPIVISGVDFEQCTHHCVSAVGDPGDARRAGPILVTGSFLHSLSGSKVYASNAEVTVTGSRMYPGSVDFETDTGNKGCIFADNNTYAGGLDIAPGSNVVIGINDGYQTHANNYVSHKSASFVNGASIRNYQYKDSPYLRSSGADYYSYYVGGPTGQYVSFADWWISEYKHVTAPDVLNKIIGVRLANDAGQNAFQPMYDNATTLGGLTARWSVVYSATGTINTSDERAKQDIAELDDAERRVAARLKGLIRKYRFKDAVEKKGPDARIHVGVVAQDVIEAFGSEGLDAMKYAIVCYDAWGDSEAVVDADGQTVRDAIAAGDRYGIRYDEMMAFIISAM